MSCFGWLNVGISITNAFFPFMRKGYSQLILKPCKLSLMTLLALSTSLDATAGYVGESFIQMPGVTGGWAGDTYRDWIKFESMEWSDNPRCNGRKTNPVALECDEQFWRPRSSRLIVSGPWAPQSGEGQLAVALDKRSPVLQDLMQLCRSGKTIPELVYAESSQRSRRIGEVGSRPAGVPEYFEYKLSGVKLGCPVVTNAPEQAFELNFTDIELTGFRDNRSELRVNFELGTDKLISAELYTPFLINQLLFTSFKSTYSVEQKKFSLSGNELSSIDNDFPLEYSDLVLEVAFGLQGRLWSDFRIGGRYTKGDVAFSSISSIDASYTREGVFAQYRLDTLDNYTFPTKGFYVRSEYLYSHDNVDDSVIDIDGTKDSVIEFTVNTRAAWTYSRHTFVGNFEYGVVDCWLYDMAGWFYWCAVRKL